MGAVKHRADISRFVGSWKFSRISYQDSENDRFIPLDLPLISPRITTNQWQKRRKYPFGKEGNLLEFLNAASFLVSIRSIFR